MLENADGRFGAHSGLSSCSAESFATVVPDDHPSRGFLVEYRGKQQEGHHSPRLFIIYLNLPHPDPRCRQWELRISSLSAFLA